MTTDRTSLSDRVSVARLPGVPIEDRVSFRGQFQIERFDVPVEWYAERYARNHFTLAERERVDTLIRDARWPELPATLRSVADWEMRAQHESIHTSIFPNGGLSTGCLAIWNLIIAAGTTNGGGAAGANAQFTNAQTRLAIGDSSTAFAASQTWLQAATNKWAQVMDATFPSAAAGPPAIITFKITVAGGNANFLWNEFCTDNAGNSTSVTGASATLVGGSALNRAVSNQGTKTSGQSWALTLTITVA